MKISSLATIHVYLNANDESYIVSVFACVCVCVRVFGALSVFLSLVNAIKNYTLP